MPSFLQKAADWLSPRRIRAHAIILALCVWGVVIVDLAVPGIMDRAGNIKFQDFLPFYIAGREVAQNQPGDLYQPQVGDHEVEALLGHPTPVRVPFAYGPQVAFCFSFFGRFSFLAAAMLWTILTIILYFFCCWLVWRSCPTLQADPGLIALLVLAFPPFFHFVLRGQISAVVLACFAVAFYAFQAKHDWLASFALGSLVFKPQFLIAVAVIFVAARGWKLLGGVAIAVAAQLGFAWAYFGPTVMRSYAAALWRITHSTALVEPGYAAAQMHSLRSFWWLLIPWPAAVSALYGLSAFAVLVLAVSCWKSSGPLALRFPALILAAILVNPHLFVYDLLVLAPALLLLADWALQNLQHPGSPALRVLLYLTYLLPLFGPLALWTHVQLSVPALVAILWLLWHILKEDARVHLSPAAAAS